MSASSCSTDKLLPAKYDLFSFPAIGHLHELFKIFENITTA